MTLGAYGRPLNRVTSFRYLGRVILVANEDWPAVIRNLAKAREVCRTILRVLSKEGAKLRVSGFFFKSVIQSVFLFGAKTWVVAPRTVRALWGPGPGVAATHGASPVAVGWR